jgi:serine/threonine protein kinase
LILGTDGILRIIDFGLAQTATALSDPATNEGILAQTEQLPDAGAYALLAPAVSSLDAFTPNDVSVPMGSVDFLAPEQGSGAGGDDPRSDIYSLGCTLYFLLTTRPVYPGVTVVERMMAHRDRPLPALSDSRPDVPAALDRVFLRMVAKKPDDRYQTAADVITALQDCSDRLLPEPADLARLVAAARHKAEAAKVIPSPARGGGAACVLAVGNAPSPAFGSEDPTGPLPKLPPRTRSQRQRDVLALLAVITLLAALIVLMLVIAEL